MNNDMSPVSYEPCRGHKNILKIKVFKLWHQPAVSSCIRANLTAAALRPSLAELEEAHCSWKIV